MNLCFLALVSLLAVSWSQPVRAQGVSPLRVYNKTKDVIVVDVIYHVCRDDVHRIIRPGDAFLIEAGMCAVKEVRAKLSHTVCTPYKGIGRTFTVTGDRKSCKVT